MYLTPHSPVQAAFDRGKTFCENSVREGMIFILWRDSQLLYSIAIDLVLNGGTRLGHMMSKRHILLRASVQGSWLVDVFKPERLGSVCDTPEGVKWLNIEQCAPSSLHFLSHSPPFPP